MEPVSLFGRGRPRRRRPARRKKRGGIEKNGLLVHGLGRGGCVGGIDMGRGVDGI